MSEWNGMSKGDLKNEIKELIIEAQRNEVTEYHIYKSLARHARDLSNKKLLEQIAAEELEHYRFWMNYGDEVDPKWWKVNLYIFLSRIFGFVFALKLMEHNEQIAQKKYLALSKVIPEVEKLADDEKGHEKILLNMVSDNRLKGMGAWIISVNLIIFSLIFFIYALSVCLQNNHSLAPIGMISILAVAGADLFSTLFLRNSQSIHKDQVKKGFFRFVSGIVTGGVILIPFYLSLDVIEALIFSTAIAIMVSLLLNYQFAVVSDQKGYKRIARIFLVFLILVTMGLIAGFILGQIFLFQGFNVTNP